MSEENKGQEEEKDDSVDSDSVGELADALDVDDPEERRQLIAKFSKITSSPVPPPKVLKGYNDVVDGGAKWLMEYTQAEQLHRHKMDNKELNYYSAGQVFGFVLGLIGIGGGLFLASTGAAWFGFAAFFTSLVSLVGLFVYNKREESKKDS